MKRFALFFRFLILIIFMSTLISNDMKAQTPPYFTDYLDCSSCMEDNMGSEALLTDCNNASSYFNSNPFYMINPSSTVKTVRLNFIFVQKDDGSGNFNVNDPDHQMMIDDIIATMNEKMSNMAIASCGGTNSHSKIQYEVNKMYIQDTYLWNNDNDNQGYKCPNRSTWYLRPKAVQIDSDPSIPLGIDIFFTNGETAYNYNVVNNNSDYQGVNYACSMFPTNDYSEGSYVHMPDCFTKYYWMKEWATQIYTQPWIPVVYSWYLNSTAETILHELGHSLGLYHEYTCITHNIMNNAGSGCAHDYLTDAQLYTSHRNLSLKNIRKFVKEQTSLDAPLIVTGNELIDFNTRLYRDIIIENGGSLTISCVVLMPAIGKIVVKQGGKLIVDGGIITNAQDDLWQGIQVWGNKTAHQFPDANGNYQQGYLKLMNGAIIENAIVAVDLWNPDQWNTTGGMIYADGAVFRNNAKSVHALHYRNFNPYNTTQEMEYSSNFKNCTFEITADYTGDVTFFKHVDLSHVNGIDFQACDFSLDENVSGVSTYSHGIAGYDAKFRVSAICNSPQYPCPETGYDKCTFTGFYNGVSAVNDGTSIATFNVNRAVFNDNDYGVMTRRMDNATVILSDFGIGHLWECGAGIYADNVTGFAFEENDFSKYPGGPVSNYFGIIINNSASINEVYKNNFSGLSYGNFADGKNWVGTDRYQGLAYFCNENQSNYADFYVADFKPEKQTGIQSFQGDDNHVAGNTYTQSDATWHFYNGGEHLVAYYYNQNNSIEIPDDDKIYHVVKVGRNVTNTCPPHYGGTADLKLGLSTQQKLDAELEYYDNLSDYNSVSSLYDSYVDGGSTASELSDIQSALPEDMWTLRSQLLGDSPHLSLEVLKEVADKTDVFTESALFDILAANPDELKKDTLISYLENKEEPLPEYMIDILKQLAEGVTYKTILQQQLSFYKQNYSRAANEIIRSILNDTITNYAELRNWLDNLGGITSDRQIISAYLSEGNYTDALNLANMLSQLYKLEGDELIEHGYYVDMLNLYQTLNQQGRNTYQLTIAEKSYIELLAEKSSGIAGAQAKSIMEAVYDVYSTDCPKADGVAGYKQSGMISPEKFGKAYGLNITVKPNPASQWAAFDYTLPERQSVGMITITDVTGHTIEVLDVTGQQGQILWDTRNLNSGVYIYTLTTGGFSQSGKIVIRK